MADHTITDEQQSGAAGAATTREIVLAALLAAAAVALFLAFEVRVLFERWGDEVVHIYVSKRVAEGALLYRDIHSARPPLAILPLALLQWLGVSPLLAARSLAAGCTLATGAVLGWLGRRFFGGVVALVAFVLFVHAPDGIARFQFSGIHGVALFSTLTLTLAWVGRPVWAGLAAGLAMASGQHAAIAVVFAGAWLWLFGTRKLAAFAAASLLVFATAIVYFVARGADVFQDVFTTHLYHLQSGGAVDKAEEGLHFDLLTWFLDNAVFFLAALFGVGARWRRRGFDRAAFATNPKRSRKNAAPRRPNPTEKEVLGWRARLLRSKPEWRLLAFVACHGLAVVSMRGGLILYTYVCVPMLVLLGARGLCQAYEWWNTRRLMSRLPTALRFGCFLGVVFATMSLGWLMTSTLVGRRDGEKYSVLPHLRAVEMADLQAMTQSQTAAQMIRADAGPDETIFGQAPLSSSVALASGRRVAGELADLANRWIITGQLRRSEIVERIERDRVGYFVSPNWFFMKDPFFRGYLERCYENKRVVHRAKGRGRGIPEFLVLRHKPVRPCQ